MIDPDPVRLGLKTGAKIAFHTNKESCPDCGNVIIDKEGMKKMFYDLGTSDPVGFLKADTDITEEQMLEIKNRAMDVEIEDGGMLLCADCKSEVDSDFH